jgi:transketolase
MRVSREEGIENKKGMEDRAVRLEGIAREIRIRVVEMVHLAGSGHCGGALSSADLVAALYFDIMRINPDDPLWPGRDRFVLSKGHACPVWYAALALRGYFPESDLSRLRKIDSPLQGHPAAGKARGVDATSGSLGIGFCEALGMALEAKMAKKGYRVYAILGDGELDEGAVWEAAAAAAKFRLDNLVAIVDRNGLQNDGESASVMPMEPIDRKFEAFSWDVEEIDGHDMPAILASLERARDRRGGRPLCLIARTVKGKGVSFMEGVREWHGRPPNDDECARALAELRGERHESA